MTHLWSPWRGSCTRQGGQHTVEARSQADPLSHCAALCRPCCTTAAACPHHRRHCPHAGAGYLDARQRAKLTRSVVNSAKKTCVRRCVHVLQPSSYLSQVATWILINIRPGSYQDGSKRSGSYLVDLYDMVATRLRPGSYLVQIGANPVAPSAR
jgi:hypothetical protein